jgi:transcriptional regulator with XRE-family HTH domain
LSRWRFRQRRAVRKLRRIRAEKGLTMDALEERTGVSKRTISEIERGMRDPQTLTLAKLANALGVDLDELVEEEAPKSQAPPPPSEAGGERGSKKPEPSFHDEEERRLRYLRVPQLHATKQSELWAARVKRGVFGEEAFRKGVDDFLDFEGAFVQGVGTDLLAALREDADALPKAEREALDAAKSSIDAWHRMLWEASDILKAAAREAEAQDARKVIDLDAHRERLKQRARGEFARGIEADDGANVS